MLPIALIFCCALTIMLTSAQVYDNNRGTLYVDPYVTQIVDPYVTRIIPNNNGYNNGNPNNGYGNNGYNGNSGNNYNNQDPRRPTVTVTTGKK